MLYSGETNYGRLTVRSIVFMSIVLTIHTAMFVPSQSHRAYNVRPAVGLLPATKVFVTLLPSIDFLPLSNVRATNFMFPSFDVRPHRLSM